MNEHSSNVSRGVFDAVQNGHVADFARNVLLFNQARTQQLADTMIRHLAENTQSALDAWKEVASAHSFAEANAIQINFAQKQCATLVKQGQELADLSARLLPGVGRPTNSKTH